MQKAGSSLAKQHVNVSFRILLNKVLARHLGLLGRGGSRKGIAISSPLQNSQTKKPP